MKTIEQILSIFISQGFYCSSRKILEQAPNQSENRINQAITQARKLGLPNVDQLNSNKLTEAIRYFQTSKRQELEDKANKLIQLLFTE